MHFRAGHHAEEIHQGFHHAPTIRASRATLTLPHLAARDYLNSHFPSHLFPDGLLDVVPILRRRSPKRRFGQQHICAFQSKATARELYSFFPIETLASRGFAASGRYQHLGAGAGDSMPMTIDMANSCQFLISHYFFELIASPL